MASPSALPGTFKTFGVIYLVLTIIGFFVVSPEGTGEIFNAVTVNNTDNWLHLALGVILFLIGYAPATEEVRTSNSEIKRPIAR